MIALGWTTGGAVPPAPLRVLGDGPVGVLAADGDSGGTARARLALQVAASRVLEALLPLAPRQSIPAAAAVDRALAEPEEILAQLDALRGRGQLTAGFVAPACQAGEPTPGDGWLRRRAAERSRIDRAGEAALALVDAAGIGVERHVARAAPGGFALDLLLRRDAIDAAMDRLSDHAARATPARLSHWRMTLAGPWPAYGFAGPA